MHERDNSYAQGTTGLTIARYEHVYWLQRQRRRHCVLRGERMTLAVCATRLGMKMLSRENI